MVKTKYLVIVLLSYLLISAEDPESNFSTPIPLQFEPLVQWYQGNVFTTAFNKILKEAYFSENCNGKNNLNIADYDQFKEFVSRIGGAEFVVNHEKPDTSHFAAIGVQVSAINKGAIVTGVIPNTPAYYSNICTGDTIINVDGSVLEKSSTNAIVAKLRGKKDSAIQLDIACKNGHRSLSLVRDYISIIPLIHYYDTSEKTLYFRIVNFNEELIDTLKDVLTKTPNRKGIIIDMRDCFGGRVTVVTECARLFLSRNQIIIRAKGNSCVGEKITKSNTAYSRRVKDNIVIITNRYTAAGAECFVAALVENRRAVSIGTKTKGDGYIKSVVPIDDTSRVILLTYVMLTPNGSSIQENGVRPLISTESTETSFNIPCEPIKLKRDELICAASRILSDTKEYTKLIRDNKTSSFKPKSN